MQVTTNRQIAVTTSERSPSLRSNAESFFTQLLLSWPILFVVVTFASTMSTVAIVATVEKIQANKRARVSAAIGAEISRHRHRADYISSKIAAINGEVDSVALARIIVSESDRVGYDPMKVTAVIKAESAFRADAHSRKGARGVMQIMPTTGQYIAEQSGISWRGADALYDTRYNVRLGIAYLQYLERKYQGNFDLTLMAYNWGPRNVEEVLQEEKTVLPAVKAYMESIGSLATKLDYEYQAMLLGGKGIPE